MLLTKRREFSMFFISCGECGYSDVEAEKLIVCPDCKGMHLVAEEIDAEDFGEESYD